jgi:hypothetical protein
MLTNRHKEARVNWCLKNRNTDWSKVVFTDESYFLFHRNKEREWQKEDQKSRPQNINHLS